LKPNQGLAKINETQPRLRHSLRDRGKTKAEGCQGRTKTKTGKKMPGGCLGARQLHLWQT